MSSKSFIDDQQLADLLGSALPEEPSPMLTKAVMSRLAMGPLAEAKPRFKVAHHGRVAVSIAGSLFLLLGLLVIWFYESTRSVWPLTNLVRVRLDRVDRAPIAEIAEIKMEPTSLVTSIGLLCIVIAVWLVGSIERYHRFSNLTHKT